MAKMTTDEVIEVLISKKYEEVKHYTDKQIMDTLDNIHMGLLQDRINSLTDNYIKNKENSMVKQAILLAAVTRVNERRYLND